MKVHIYWIPGAQGPPLGIMPRPRGDDWLGDEIRSLRSQGVDVLVSLLTTGEIEELDLADEAAACRSIGIQFLSFPIDDRSVPANTRAALEFVRLLRQLRLDGRTVVIHCRAGIGRSSMIAAATLTLNPEDVIPAEAWEMIGRARGCSVPDTAQQVAWVERLHGT